MKKILDGYKTCGEGHGGTKGQPGSSFRLAHCVISRRGAAYRAYVRVSSGSNQVYLETHNEAEWVFRGRSLESLLREFRSSKIGEQHPHAKEAFDSAFDEADERATCQ